MSTKRKYGRQGKAATPAETPAATPAGSVPATDPVVKSDDKDEDDEEGDEDDEEEDDKVDKSDLALADLEKGLQVLEQLGKTPPKSRKQELLQKAMTSRLSKAERAELDAEIDGPLSKALEQEEDLVKGMDVSPALDVLATKVSAAVDKLSAQIADNATQAGAFNEALCKSLVAIGSLVKAQQEQIDGLSETLEKALDKPERQAKAADATSVKPPAERTVVQHKDSRGLIPVLERMHQDSISKGHRGFSPSGVPLRGEMAKAVHGDPLDPKMLQDIQTFAGAR